MDHLSMIDYYLQKEADYLALIHHLVVLVFTLMDLGSYQELQAR